MHDNIPLLGIPTTPMTSALSSVMWIISPRYYSHQVKRPMLYNFNGRIIEEAEMAVAKGSNRNPVGIESIVSSPVWMQSIFPDSHGPKINMDPLREKWTYMLIVNNDKSSPGGTIRSISDSQHLYYGFFVDEPLNPISHSGQPTFNPNATMYITHRTLIGDSKSFGAYGPQSRIDVMSDVDIIHPNLMGNLTSDSVSLLLPETLYQCTGGGGDTYVMHSESNMIEHQGDPLQISSNLAVPRHNMEKILNAVANARGTVYSKMAAGEQNLLDLQPLTFRDMVEANLQDNCRLQLTGLEIGRSYTLGMIMQRYNPNMQVAQQDLTPHYDPIDQSVVNARNIFSSMLTTVVPAMMVAFKLIEIAFYYDSHHDYLQLFEQSPPATIVPMSDEARKFQVNGFIRRLTTEILPLLKMNHGDFRLSMNCSSGGVTHINLNFLDDSTSTNEVFEVPTIYGGLNSPLVGTTPVFERNARELHGLITSLTDSHTDSQPPLGVYDNDRFSQNLLNYDQTVPPHSSNIGRFGV